MNCDEVLASMEAFLDDEVDEPQRVVMQSHILVCQSCDRALERVTTLRGLLKRGSIMEPSASVEAKLMSAFVRKHGLRSGSAWWRNLFFGSVNIPKPAMAMAAIIIVVVLVGAVKVGMMTSPIAIVTLPDPSLSNPRVSPPATPETRIVEVPVIREKIRTIYLAARPRAASRPPNSDLSPGASDLAMNGSVGEKGYFTRVNLSGFLPSSEMKTRVISEVKPNEK